MSDRQLTRAHWETSRVHFTSQGIPLVASDSGSGGSNLVRSCLPHPSSGLRLIRVIATGPPETTELRNCYSFTRFKDRLIKPLCVYIFNSLLCGHTS